MLLFVEIVSPIRIFVAVHLMVAFTVDTFEKMRARLTVTTFKLSLYYNLGKDLR